MHEGMEADGLAAIGVEHIDLHVGGWVILLSARCGESERGE